MQPRITLCSVCHSQMPAGQSLCKNCGSTLCPHCRELLPQRSRYCPKCGFLSIAEEQAPIRKAASSATSARPQAIPIPRVSVAVPQSVAQAAVRQQSFGTPIVQHQRNCPKCGASIDHELGRCSGCGLLYGVKHRVIQQQTPSATLPARSPLPPRPQSATGQQPPAAQAMRPQYGNPGPVLPVPSFRQSPTNYGSPGRMPQGGILMPIPSMAPAAAGAMSVSVPMAPRPYQYQTIPPTSMGRGMSAPGNRGLMGVVTTALIIIILFLAGSGIYYLLNRTGTTPAIYSPTNDSIARMQDISATETGATITWKTDQPASSQVIVRDSSGAIITEVEPQETLDTGHSVVVSGLKPNTTYYYTLISTDATGTDTTSEGKLTTTTATTAVVTADKTSPTIAGVNISNISESSATVTWTTNEPATSQVKYEKSERSGSTTPINKNLTTNHIVRIANLESGITYNYSVISRDAAGNEVVSAVKQTFRTLAPIPVGSKVGNRAPDFTLKDLNGKDVRLGDFRGKIVMINFWAIWCDPCVKELPAINAVFKEWEDKGLVVLAIAVNKNEQLSSVELFIRQSKYTFPVLFDAQGQANSRYGVGTYPTTFFIDAEGIVRKVQVGSFQDQATIEKILGSLK